MTLAFELGQARLYQEDCRAWLGERAEKSIHAVVTDPPYGLFEYSEAEQAKLRARKGGGWRIPPAYDGHERSPLPRFTTLTAKQLVELEAFFTEWATILRPTLVPGAHVLVASNPLVSHYVSIALTRAGMERRGEIVRLVQTMRGGDRPKGAHDEFHNLSVMPRSKWEPWVLFREPLETGTTVAENLRKYKTGAFRRISDDKPFADVIQSGPTGKAERNLAGHPSLKPQAFLRQVVRAILPMGEGTVLDPFAGSGSTLAAAEAVGYESIGIEADPHYVDIAKLAMPALAAFTVSSS